MIETHCKGKVNIWYRIPSLVTVPKQICYQFSNGASVCIEGESYEITSESSGSFQGGQCDNKSYDVYWTFSLKGDNGQPFSYADNISGVNRNVSGKIVCMGLIGSPEENYCTIRANTTVVVIGFNNSQGKYFHYAAVGFGQYGFIANFEGGITSVVRTDGTSLADDIAQCGTLGSTTYCIKIYDSGNNLIHEHCQESASPPAVTIISASQECTFSNSTWQLGKRQNSGGKRLTVSPKNYTSPTGKKCTQAIVTFSDPTVRSVGFPALDVCSPDGCSLFPEIRSISESKGNCNCETKAENFEICCDEVYVGLNQNGFSVNTRQHQRDFGVPDLFLFRKCVRGVIEGDKFNVYSILKFAAPPSKKIKEDKRLIFSIDKCKVTRLEPRCSKPPRKPDPEKCPPNTCYECESNGYKCCYDGNLKLIKSFKI